MNKLKLMALLVAIIVFVMTFPGCNSSQTQTSGTEAPTAPTDFKYSADETYSFGDIEFKSSSILTFEENEDGGTFTCSDPQIYMNVYRLPTNEEASMIKTHPIPDTATVELNSDDNDLYGHQLLMQKYIIHDPKETYNGVIAFDHNGWTYTFMCTTSIQDQQLCKDVLNGVILSLVFLEGETDSSESSIANTEDSDNNDSFIYTPDADQSFKTISFKYDHRFIVNEEEEKININHVDPNVISYIQVFNSIDGFDYTYPLDGMISSNDKEEYSKEINVKGHSVFRADTSRTEGGMTYYTHRAIIEDQDLIYAFVCMAGDEESKIVCEDMMYSFIDSLKFTR